MPGKRERWSVKAFLDERRECFFIEDDLPAPNEEAEEEGEARMINIAASGRVCMC